MAQSRTLLDKIWDAHVVRPETPEAPAVLYIDLHLVHEVTSPQAFTVLRERGLKVHRPERTVATMDHSTPTLPRVNGRFPFAHADAQTQVETLERNCREHGIALHALGSETQGIVHVIGPELGLTRPGMTVVCGDSHTSTHGAFGALAFGIGTSEVAHVLATQCLLQRKPRSMRVRIDGTLQPGVTAKDVILAVIARIGVGGGTGHVIEYAGSAVEAMSADERMTVCNMSIEAGARAGMIASGEWRSDPDARFDKEVHLDARTIAPMITWGTDPGTAIPVDGRVPAQAAEKAASYMRVKPGEKLLGTKIDVVFVGSCTNGRLSDLRAAASVLRGRKVAARTLVVPGSQRVKKQAEAEGLDAVFREAGAEWREPGCSMCIAMNGDSLKAGEACVSTSNRNFEGRQGPGGRTFLASPLTAAAAAVNGAITDPREVLR